MAKSMLRIKAREMRSRGESVKVIAKTLGVAKSTTSLWVRDIILTVDQLEKLIKRKIKGGELGRAKGAFMQKQRRILAEEKYQKEGLKDIGGLSERELLVSGLCLYWGEGTKKVRELSFCNSDPTLINFMTRWLSRIYNVSRQDLAARVGINEIHKRREQIVKNYWSKTAGIPLSQFRKTSFKKAKPHKIYANFNEHYGTLTVKVLKSAQLYYKIMGQIEALSRQGSSTVEQRFHKSEAVGPNPTPGT